MQRTGAPAAAMSAQSGVPAGMMPGGGDAGIAPAGPQQAEDATGRPTDAEKDAYRHFLANTVDMVYQDEIAEQLNSEAPVEGLTQRIAMVVNDIGQDGLACGVPVHGAMAVAAAATLAGDIGINMAEAVGKSR